MSSTAVQMMPMPMRLSGSVAPAAGVHASWRRAVALVPAGVELGQRSSSRCITTGTDQNDVTEINTDKAYGARRPLECST